MASNLVDSPTSPLPEEEELTEAELRQFDLLAALREPVDLEPYLPQVVLRWLPSGTVIYPREGVDRAIVYLPTWEEVLRLKLSQLERAEEAYERMLTQDEGQRDAQATRDIQHWIEQLSGIVSEFERRAWDRSAAEKRGEPLPPVARLTAPSAPPAAPSSPGLLSKFSRLLGSRKDAPAKPPPTTTVVVEFYEGELLDPVCLSAYVPGGLLHIEAVASCYALELPQSLYAKLAADDQFRTAADAGYRQRLLATHLRLAPILSRIDAAAMSLLTERAELLTADPGAVICDEHQMADGLYIVRSGVVEVLHNQSALVHPGEIADWPAVCRALLAGDDGRS
jgi:hypothetical protein